MKQWKDLLPYMDFLSSLPYIMSLVILPQFPTSACVGKTTKVTLVFAHNFFAWWPILSYPSKKSEEEQELFDRQIKMYFSRAPNKIYRTEKKPRANLNLVLLSSLRTPCANMSLLPTHFFFEIWRETLKTAHRRLLLIYQIWNELKKPLIGNICRANFRTGKIHLPDSFLQRCCEEEKKKFLFSPFPLAFLWEQLSIKI